MFKKVIYSGLSLMMLFCLYVESTQMEYIEKAKYQLPEMRTNNEIIDESINFDELNYNIVTEKIAVNPHFVYTNEEKTIYALKDNTAIYDSPKEDKKELFKINKRDSVKALGYNDFNNTYKIQDISENICYVSADDFGDDKNLILDKIEGQKYTNSNTSIKEYPSTDSKSIKQLSVNTKIDLLFINDNGYYKVKSEEIEGYIHKDNLSDTKTNYITDLQKKVSRIARNNQGTYPCTANYCAAWVSGIYQAAGACNPSGNAIDYWLQWSHTGSTSMNNIPVGAVVVGSGSGSSMGNKYGHVGVYLGDGMVADNVGYHRIVSLKEWASGQVGYCRGYHGYIGWVWPCNKELGNGI